MAIRLILVDDEPLARLGIRARLQGHRDFKVVAEASSAKEALRQIRRLRPDAIFLDIEMMSSSGLDLARMLEEPYKPLIIFLTAHQHYALQAFEVKAIDYLLKPLHDTRFELTLDRIREAMFLNAQHSILPGKATAQIDAAPGLIALPKGRKTQLIEMSAIDWVCSAGDYTKLHVGSKTHLLREPLSLFLTRLPHDAFCRIHRSSVVNLRQVSGFITLRNQDLLVSLKDGTILRASRTFSDAFKKALLEP